MKINLDDDKVSLILIIGWFVAILTIAIIFT